MNARLWRQVLKRLFALGCVSCEGFPTSGNAVVTGAPHGNMQQEQRSLTICWMAWIVLQPFSSFAKHSFNTRVHSPLHDGLT